MIQLQTWGGWGDVLRELGLLPCSRLPGLFSVRHLPREQAGVLEGLRVPDAEEVAGLVRRVPALRWGGTGAVPRGHKIFCRLLRAALEPFHAGLFRPAFCWQAQDDLPPGLPEQFTLVQTHLEGMPTKRWGVEAWRAVLDGLRELMPGRPVHVLDPSGGALAGSADAVHDRLSFARALRLVERASLLVSVDSWTKYPAAWAGIPQVVIVPDQTPDYPQLTARAIWRHSLRGLRGRRGVVIVGVCPRGREFTFGSLQNLDPGEVWQAVRRAVTTDKKNPFPPAAGV